MPTPQPSPAPDTHNSSDSTTDSSPAGWIAIPIIAVLFFLAGAAYLYAYCRRNAAAGIVDTIDDIVPTVVTDTTSTTTTTPAVLEPVTPFSEILQMPTEAGHPTFQHSERITNPVPLIYSLGRETLNAARIMGLDSSARPTFASSSNRILRGDIGAAEIIDCSATLFVEAPLNALRQFSTVAERPTTGIVPNVDALTT